MRNLLLALLLVPLVLLLPWIVPAWQRRRGRALLVGGLWLAGLATALFVALGPGLLLLLTLGVFQLLITSVPLSGQA